jgi:hypothetical protein
MELIHQVFELSEGSVELHSNLSAVLTLLRKICPAPRGAELSGCRAQRS